MKRTRKDRIGKGKCDEDEGAQRDGEEWVGNGEGDGEEWVGNGEGGCISPWKWSFSCFIKPKN